MLSGECDHKLGDEVIPLRPGMMLRIPRNVKHNAVQHGLATGHDDHLLFRCRPTNRPLKSENNSKVVSALSTQTVGKLDPY